MQNTNTFMRGAMGSNGGVKVLSINTALAETLQTSQGAVASGIRKRPREGRIALAALGLEGDEQADLSVHGGFGKALYAYPTEHYAFWQTVRAQAGAAAWGDPLAPGSLGENLSLAGLLETEVWIGDRLSFADCELIVSEPRIPCFKLNAALEFAQAVKMMVQSGWCGFYLAVQRPGSLAAGDSFELRPGPRDIGIAELFRARTRKG